MSIHLIVLGTVAGISTASAIFAHGKNGTALPAERLVAAVTWPIGACAIVAIGSLMSAGLLYERIAKPPLQGPRRS